MRKEHKSHWWILDHWEDWEARKLPMYYRYREYQLSFGGNLLRDVPSYKRIVNGFTKTCSTFLRLKFTGKKDRKLSKKLAANNWQPVFSGSQTR